MKIIYIYTLSDSSGVRYVGQTSNPKSRLYRHIRDAKVSGHKNKRCSWIKSLINKGEKPIMEILEEVNETNWSVCEQYWISQFKTWGFDLVNDTDGGEGSYGRKTSDETKHKMSLAKKGVVPKNINIFKKSTIKGKIIQYDLKGNKVAVYESANYIKETLKIININSVINKKRNTAGGYIWRLEGDELLEKDIIEITEKHLKQTKKPIIQFSKDGILIKEWESVNDVKKIYPHINAVLGGRRKTAGGYIWKYKL